MKAYTARKGTRYYVVVEEGADPATGKRRRTWHSGYRTKKAAEAGLRTILSDQERGTYTPPDRTTVAGFISEDWLPAIRSNVRPGTFALYETLMRAYVVPRLGARRLQDIRPAHLNAVYDELLAGGGRGGRALAPKTVRNVHVTLHRALRDAVRWGRLSRNPADLASPPRARTAEMRTWTAEDVGTFLAHVRDDRLYAAWLTLATAGLRRGELLGLRWQDVDLEAGRLAIRQTLVLVGGRPQFSEPKTAKGRRSVPIPPATVAGLRAHHRRQFEERVALGPAYQVGGLVFCREDGAALNPDTFSEWFERLARAAGLPGIRVHDVRHSFATLALRTGVPAKVVSEILGHASIGITLDTYSHAVPSMQEEAAAKVAALIFG